MNIFIKSIYKRISALSCLSEFRIRPQQRFLFKILYIDSENINQWLSSILLSGVNFAIIANWDIRDYVGGLLATESTFEQLLDY